MNRKSLYQLLHLQERGRADASLGCLIFAYTFTNYRAMVQKVSDQEQPILPRSPWKDRRAWLKLMIETKKALEEAEKKSLRANSIRDFQ